MGTGSLLEPAGEGLQADPLGGPVRSAQKVGATFLEVLGGGVVAQVGGEEDVGTCLTSPLQKRVSRPT